MKNRAYTRREILKLYGFTGLGLIATPLVVSFTAKENIMLRTIPSSKEKLPVVGLGTWQTFDVGNSVTKREVLKNVLIEMNKLGGSVIDSSPMYGSSEQVVGDLTTNLNFADDLFYATKVWTTGKEAGISQIKNSFRRMQRQQMDLIQIHNLTDWKTHVKTLKEYKEKGKIKYWGITHYVDSSHHQLERIIKSEKPDFVQFNYSIGSRHAEKSLFDTAKNNNTAVIINQPYESGSLFRLVKEKTLPKWAKEYDIHSWGQYFLKFILSNESVTCVIPGTSKPHHMIDNMMAGYGSMPDEKGRNKMYNHFRGL